MKSLTTAGVIGILALMTTSNPLSAQAVWIGGVGTFPTSDYGEYANTGFLFMAGAGLPVGDPGVSVGLGGYYGQHNHEAADGDKTNPYGLPGYVEDDRAGPAAERTFYALGEWGVLWHEFGSDCVPAPTGPCCAYWCAPRYAGCNALQ